MPETSTCHWTLRLPNEVVELIIVLSNRSSTLAALAQTCRDLRSLIYAAPDSHLWRRMYLTQFDDPRESCSFRVDGDATIDWGMEYRWKIWSLNFLRASSNREEVYLADYRLPEFRPNSPSNDTDPRLSAWKGLLSLLRTARPIKGRNANTELPHTSTTLISVHKQTPRIPQTRNISGDYCSNTSRCAFVFSPKGIPYPLFVRIAADSINQGWDYTAEGQLFYQYIACFGIDPDFGTSHGETNTTHTEHRSSDKNGSSYPPAIVSRAQRRVYDMSYPEDQAMYGPFLPTNPAEAAPTVPSACLYVPDWAQLAAIRLYIQQAILTEADLTFLNFLFDHHTLRPGFWGPRHDPSTSLIAGEQVAASDEHSERDWAGVEGVWRRLVTWLGWEALLDYNFSNFEHQPEIICRIIVPLRLHIVSYSHEDAISPNFPIINFEGEMGGQDWDEDSEDQDATPDVRHLTGSVSMLVDGSVRWSMCSYIGSSKSEVEWLSEGVQLGGIGSMAGVMGLWTGTTHDEDDNPIGGWWQWRVA